MVLALIGWRRLMDMVGATSLAIVAIMATMAVVAVVVAPYYHGAIGPYLLFHAACILLALTIFLPPVSYGFATLAVFLLLGFWLKVVTAALGAGVLIEPVGAFGGSGAEWDRALVLASTGLAGVAFSKGLWCVLARGSRQEAADCRIPGWYVHGRRFVWLGTFLLILAGNLANWRLRFYVVGVHERLILPLHLNVLVSWWLTVGSGVWLAALLEWERRLNPETPFGRWLLIPLGEAVLTAVVMLSRGFYLMKAIPYALVLARAGVRRSLRLRPLTLAALALTAVGGFGASLAGGSLLRISIYPNVELDRSQNTSATASGLATSAVVPITRRPNSRDIRRSIDELKRMVVGRWIGLEGILAVSASPVLSVGLWSRALVEDPRAGNAALYQRISRAKYQAQAGFTFLTLPGVVAVMSYSGSAWVVLLGMMFVTSIVLATEATFRRLFYNEFLCAVVGVAMANTLAQMNFPYLTVIFFLEMWATLAGLWLMSLIGASPGRPAVGRYIVAASTPP